METMRNNLDNYRAVTSVLIILHQVWSRWRREIKLYKCWLILDNYERHNPDNGVKLILTSRIILVMWREIIWRSVWILLILYIFNPNYPSCCAKMNTLFGIIFWNNFAWLNMFCALLNAARFEGQWVWLSFYISFYKDGTPPAPPCVQNICIIYAHTGAGLIRVSRNNLDNNEKLIHIVEGSILVDIFTTTKHFYNKNIFVCSLWGQVVFLPLEKYFKSLVTVPLSPASVCENSFLCVTPRPIMESGLVSSVLL